jgi:hypothetical protein
MFSPIVNSTVVLNWESMANVTFDVKPPRYLSIEPATPARTDVPGEFSAINTHPN